MLAEDGSSWTTHTEDEGIRKEVFFEVLRMSVHFAPSLMEVMALCVDDIPVPRGLSTINGCVLIDKPIYANGDDCAKNYATFDGANVEMQRAKRDCADNVRMNIACASDGGFQCGGGAGCVNYLRLDSSLYWDFKTYPDARMGGCVFMGKDALGEGDLDVGAWVLYAGVYMLERDMLVNLDPRYLAINGGHKYEGQKIGIDARHYGSMGTLANTADRHVEGGNNVVLDHRYIDGNVLVAVLRVTKRVEPGVELLRDWDRYLPMKHTLWRLPKDMSAFVSGDHRQLRLYCTHHATNIGNITTCVCMECNWQPVCKDCFAQHCLDPVHRKGKRKFWENKVHMEIFGAIGCPFGEAYDEAAFLGKLEFIKSK